MVFPLLRLALPLAIGVLIAGLFYRLALWILKVLLPKDKPKAIGIYCCYSSGQNPPSRGISGDTGRVFINFTRYSP